MIRKTLTVLTFLTLCFSLQAQNSQKAKALLDEVYSKVVSYDNIAIDFKYALENTDANTKSETKGSATLEGDKYLVELFGSTQLYDGKKVYTVVPDNEEVTIEDKSNDEQTITPSKMLTFYKEGHNYQWDILQNIQGRKIQFVKLTPIDSIRISNPSFWGLMLKPSISTSLLKQGRTGPRPPLPLILSKPINPYQKACLPLMRPNTRMKAIIS